jgi:hypothetical protein
MPDIQITVSGGLWAHRTASDRTATTGSSTHSVLSKAATSSWSRVEPGNLWGWGSWGSSRHPLLQQTRWLKQSNNAQAHK